MNRPFCAARWRKRREHRKTTLRQWIFFCFFSSKKKRDKRHGGRGRPTEKRRFSAHDSERKNGRFAYEPSILRSTLAQAAGAWENNIPAKDFLLLLLRRNETKDTAGEVTLRRKGAFPHMIRNKKTDGSRMNRPFCAARWRDRREHGKTTFRQRIFFCFFSSKKKRRGELFRKNEPTLYNFQTREKIFCF